MTASSESGGRERRAIRSKEGKSKPSASSAISVSVLGVATSANISIAARENRPDEKRRLSSGRLTNRWERVTSRRPNSASIPNLAVNHWTM